MEAMSHCREMRRRRCCFSTLTTAALHCVLSPLPYSPRVQVAAAAAAFPVSSRYVLAAVRAGARGGDPRPRTHPRHCQLPQQHPEVDR